MYIHTYTDFVQLIIFQYIHLSFAVRVSALFLRHHLGLIIFRLTLKSLTKCSSHLASCSISLYTVLCLRVSSVFEFRVIEVFKTPEHCMLISHCSV